jgi:hypothetical protein
MPLERSVAALERVNVLRASLGLPEKNLDHSLRPRKLVGVEGSVESASSEREISQIASGGHEASVSEDPCTYLDYPRRSPCSEKYP